MHFMEIVSSYKAQILSENSIFRDTIRIYRSALSFLIDVFNSEWDTLHSVKKAKERFNAAEHLVHGTKCNVPKYDFDARFHKMPAYLRRAVVQKALGCVSSYRSNYANWEKHGKQGKEPKLQAEHLAMPTFYNKEMYCASDDPCSAYLKLFFNNDWVWVKVRLRGTDVRYLKRYWQHCKPSAPTLEKRYGKYYLRFAFTEKVELSETPVADQRICAVDLGLNSDAVCSIMTSDGTVLARKFINFPSEKDRMYRTLGRIRRFQREHGSAQAGERWAYTRRLNIELSRKIAGAVAEYAWENHADVIVFEYLEMNGKISGSKRQKLQLWRKRDIQKRCEHQAHRKGMRISRICAWNTSRLAYDGSGIVLRDWRNHSLCAFQTGKRYNCDLSASYNIGARYFIRELLKPLPATERSLLEAKVPAVKRRTSCVYADLRELSSEMGLLMAA